MLVTEHNADLYARDNNKNTPLHSAIYEQADVINILIKEFGCDPNLKGFKGATILHLACCRGYTELMKTILSTYNLDQMPVDKNGNTPLHHATLGNRMTIAKELITHYGYPVDCKNSMKQSPLHLACNSGHIHLVRTLLSPVNQLNNNNETPLHLACTRRHQGLVQTLVMKHEADVNTHDTNNHTPLGYSI